VAEQGLTERYDDALQVLDARKADLAFPVQHFIWHAAKALILSTQGEAVQARSEAQIALAAADQSSSGFRYHQSLGLVGESHRELQERLRALSA
jgi:hypothetical protein